MPEGSHGFHAGTLTYSGAGLLALCFWLLWGDFCFTIMEVAAIATVQVKLKSLGATALALGLITMSIPQVINFLITPIISFRSDRHRGRWGRRIPFLLGATPFVVVMLVAMGSAEAVGRWLHRACPAVGSEPAAVILSIGALMVTFQVANMFISTVYYYLFNDVVPQIVLGRFMAMFRIVGTIATALFYAYLYPRSDTHFQMIFVLAAVVYGLAFTLMCLFVKEGDYPPPPAQTGSHSLIGILKTYKQECFNHRLYWLFFAANAVWLMGTSVMSTYNQFMAQQCGLTLDEFGKLSSVTLIITAILILPGGWLSDRAHPLRVLIASLWMSVLVLPIQFIFLFMDLPRDATRWVYIISQVILLPGTAIYLASTLPMFMRVLPRSRYGQFSAANAAVRALCVAVVGVAMGPFLDKLGGLIKPSYPDGKYLLVPVWVFLCLGACLWLMRKLWQQVRAHTDSAGRYHPPCVQEVM